jgi:formate hydrogenlyase subunit 4
MILDNSGFDKALIHIGSYVKFAIYGSLMYNVIVPAHWNLFLQIVLFLIVQVIFAMIIGVIESFRARNKMNKNPKFILSISAIAWLAFVIILILTDKFI